MTDAYSVHQARLFHGLAVKQLTNNASGAFEHLIIAVEYLIEAEEKRIEQKAAQEAAAREAAAQSWEAIGQPDMAAQIRGHDAPTT